MASGDRSSQSQERGGEAQSADAHDGTLSFIEDRKKRVAESMGEVADAVRGTAERLYDKGNSGVAEYMHRAADGLQRVSDAMRDRDIGWLVGEVENFARWRPAVFIGTGVAVGFLLARFLRNSAARHEAERYGLAGNDEPRRELRQEDREGNRDGSAS
jgi:ElaB/YqjD/DUF883 family membrane-anchored ribosome-binding protein